MELYNQVFITGGTLMLATMILTGASEPKPQLGKFHISTTGMADGFHIYEAIINTKTGNVICRNRICYKHYKTP
tara:strand:+ start:47 stop:268 length:222 start_codon:yes stop_codon:yes gene_type:complete